MSSVESLGAQIMKLEEAEALENPTHPVAFGALLAMDIKDPVKLLPWLPEGGLIEVFGPRGLGKSFFTMQLAASLSTGESFMRWEPPEPIGCLVVDGEMALGELRQRAKKLMSTPPKAPLEFISHEIVFDKTDRDMDLGSGEWQQAILNYVDVNPELKVVIIDNLSSLMKTVSEDKRDEWVTKVLPWLLALRRRKVAVVFVHHSGKSGAQRGTSSREDQLNTVIKLDSTPGDDATQGCQFIVRFLKSRGCYGDDVADFECVLMEDPHGRALWTCKPIEESNEEHLYRLIQSGVDSPHDAAEEMGVTRGTISKLKTKLQKKGLLAPGRDLVLAEG